MDITYIYNVLKKNKLLKEKDYQNCNIKKIIIDSREAQEFSLFIPLIGNRVDGHDYIEQALINNTRFFLIQEDVLKKNKDILKKLEKYNAIYFISKSNLKALQILAKEYLKTFNIKKIALTGSNGKTTVKELLHAILKQKYKTFKSRGNLNSVIGLPLTIFELNHKYEYGIWELGISEFGEMDVLVDILDPDIALINNIGEAHIGQFLNQDNIYIEKSKVFSLFKDKGIGFFDKESIYYNRLKNKFRGLKLIAFDKEELKQVNYLNNYMTFFYKELEFYVNLFGICQLSNIIACIKLAEYLDLNLNDIKKGIKDFKNIEKRGNLLNKDSIYYYVDCYNANPQNMYCSIDAFDKLYNKNLYNRKILLLGDMKELNNFSEIRHKELGFFILKLDIDMVFLYGFDIKDTFKVLKNKIKVYYSNEFDTLKIKFNSYIKKNDFIFLKASRSLELEKFIN